MTIKFIYICIHVYFYIPWTHCPFSKHWCRCKVIFPSLEASGWVHFKTPQLPDGFAQEMVDMGNSAQYMTATGRSTEPGVNPRTKKYGLSFGKSDSSGRSGTLLVTFSRLSSPRWKQRSDVKKSLKNDQPFTAKTKYGSLLSHVWSPISVCFSMILLDLLVPQ